jgi:hypothetical protein
MFVIISGPRKRDFKPSTTEFGRTVSRSTLHKIFMILGFLVSYRRHIYILLGTMPKLKDFRGGGNERSLRVRENAIRKVLFCASQRPVETQPIKVLEFLSVFRQEGRREIQKN